MTARSTLLVGPCKRYDLEAYVTKSDFWVVNKGGAAIRQLTMNHSVGIAAYHCFHCGEYFVPEGPYELAEAWAAALEHLQTSPYNQN